MENENKNPEFNAEQPEGAAAVESTKAPDTESETGNDTQGPADTPGDDKGCEAVTVVIIARNEQYAELMARSVKKNLIGANVDIHVVSGANLCNTDVATLLQHLPHVETERIILMTDGMIVLNPVTIYEVGVHKTGTMAEMLPSLMHKSVLEELLPEMQEYRPYANIAATYLAAVLPDVNPVTLRKWSEESWLLPLTSKNPPIQAIEQWAKTQCFMYVSPDSWTPDVVAFLNDRFSEA